MRIALIVMAFSAFELGFGSLCGRIIRLRNARSALEPRPELPGYVPGEGEGHFTLPI